MLVASSSSWLSPLPPVPLAADPCGSSNWRYSPFSNKCYKLFNEKTGWVISEFKCVFQGGHHISVHDAQDNKFVAELARQAGIVWLGALQFGTSREYTFVDRSTFGPFENWVNGVRPTYNKGKKCSKLNGETGEWLQSCCKVPASYICQKPSLTLPGEIIEDGSGLNDFRSRRFRRHSQQ
ncbi:C-type lectin domain-containing protein [Aphelenchoides fujianensis]|nr:C-type lectin domain-containing protein [Aphelenchoides fujianensis]